MLKACIYTWVILNLNLRAISWARCLLIDGRGSPSFSPCWITSFFSFCESLREPYCVYSWHPNPQVCLPHGPFLVRSPSFSSYLHPPSSSCCCSVSDHPSTAMDTMFVHRLFIWYRYLFPLPNTDYLIFCTFLHFLFWTKQTHLLFRRKVSASRIVSSTSALLPELFQKLFRLTSSKKLFCAKVK